MTDGTAARARGVSPPAVRRGAARPAGEHGPARAAVVLAAAGHQVHLPPPPVPQAVPRLRRPATARPEGRLAAAERAAPSQPQQLGAGADGGGGGGREGGRAGAAEVAGVAHEEAPKTRLVLARQAPSHRR